MSDSAQTPARHVRLARLFAAASELSPEQRLPFLQEQCNGDHALQDEVMELLAYDSMDVVVDRPLIHVEASSVVGEADEAKPPPHRQFGQYEILDVLGEGGMATVYRARQRNPQRLVALKLLRAGVGSQEAIKRFQLEARLLGRLHHPGIAQIYEAGMADCGAESQPYFAMELVSGSSLLVHARQHKLNVRSRLELLSRICDAVEHAHRQGIVHRDLKPSNIMVDESGQPKVLDFGVARIMDSDIQASTLHTRTGQLLGTLLYMSPEQAAGDSAQVDVRSDIYALGVIGFELLTERLPHTLAGKSVLEAVRSLQNDPPSRLSSIDRRFRGDIEIIISTALAPEKSRRYRSAAEMADDLRRYLRNEPICARPPSAIYRLRMFSRRHRTLVTATLMVFGLLVAAVLGTSYGLIVARVQRDEARRAADKAEALREFFLSILATPAPGAMGRDVKVTDALIAAEQGVASAFANQPELRAAVESELAKTFARLSQYDRAETHAREALSIRRRILGETHRDTIASMNDLGHVLSYSESADSKSPSYEEARSVLDHALSLARHHPVVPVEDLLHLLANRAGLAFREGDWTKAEELTREQLRLAQRHHGNDSMMAIGARHNLAVLLSKRGRHEEAELELRQVAQFRRKAFGARHPETLTAERMHALELVALKRLEEAEQVYVLQIPIARELYGDNHVELVNWKNDYAVMLKEADRDEEAVDVYLDALARLENAPWAPAFLTIIIKDSLSISLVKLGRFAEAEPLLRDCVKGLIEQHGPTAETTMFETYRLVDVLIRLAKYEEAVTLSRQLLATAESNFEQDTWAVAVSRSALARSLLAIQHDAEALALIKVFSRDCPTSTPDDHYVARMAVEQLMQSCESRGIDNPVTQVSIRQHIPSPDNQID